MYQVQTAKDQYRIKFSNSGMSHANDLSARYMRMYQHVNQKYSLLSEQFVKMCHLHKTEIEKFELTEEQSMAFDKALMASGKVISTGKLLVR
ncbi:MAG: hypothetical protein HWE34_01600 [Methylocystaceae bacterium]|nr:hypothetical protein [Methylocystaceae bacterium]